MGTLATKETAPSRLEDGGGVTMGDCQVQLPICAGLGRSGRSVMGSYGSKTGARSMCARRVARRRRTAVHGSCSTDRVGPG